MATDGILKEEVVVHVSINLALNGVLQRPWLHLVCEFPKRATINQ